MPTPPSNACGLAPQCGCGANETCDVTDTTGDVACVNAGTSALGAGCNATGNCAVGLTCGSGACRPYCDNPGSACSGSGLGTCVNIFDPQIDAGIPNANVCTINCNLETSSPCGGSSPVAGCHVFGIGGTGNAIVDCVAAGTAKQGQACSSTLLCAPGFTCVVPQGGNGVCQQWCQVAVNDCPGSLNCVGFQTAIVVGGTEFGGCQ